MARRRRGARGAVLVEALVVVVFFTIAMLGVVHFRALYLEKIEVERLSRAGGFAVAMGACRRDVAEGLAPEIGARPVARRSRDDVPEDLPLADARAAEVVHGLLDAAGNDASSVLEVRLTGPVRTTMRRSPDGPAEGFEVHLAAATWIVCADPTTEDQYVAVAKKVTQLAW